MRIAFICTANVCRSVMAHAILHREAKIRDLDIEITSAGVMDFTGTPPAENAWITCLQNNTAIPKMESTFVGGLALEGVDWFLTMEKSHSEVLCSDYNVDEIRVLLLGSFDPEGGSPEIADPINQPKASFQICFARIERCIAGFLEKGMS